MICYLYARYPSLSKTYCDSEMLALEAGGMPLVIASLNPPENTQRHERLRDLRAEVIYPPPPVIQEAKATEEDFARLLGPLIARHDRAYGAQYKAAQRARPCLVAGA